VARLPARFHENPERGLGVLRPIFRECLENGHISFYWNTRIEKLLVRDGALAGALGRNLRWGASVRFEAPAVVLATGGFQGNERLVRQHWHSGWPQPERLLLGAGENSSGAGLLMGMAAGGATHRLDHQWHYPFGVPDPRFPNENRAVSVNGLIVWKTEDGRTLKQLDEQA
jgi:predicted oxidoreductase